MTERVLIPSDRPPRILGIMMGGIGDLILFSPALRALRKKFAGCRLVLLTAQDGVERIIENEGLADGTVCLRRGPAVLRTILELRAGRFDISVSAAHINPLNAGALAWLAGIPVRVGQMVRGRKGFYTVAASLSTSGHECDGALEIVAQIGISVPAAERLPALTPTASETDAARRFLAARGVGAGALLVGIHAGSGPRQAYKRWPPERFAETADRLSEKWNATIVLAGGPGEEALAAQIIRLMKSAPLNAVGALSIRETSALIKLCRCFVSNDSGLAHIAAAVGTPLVAIFGPTNRARIAPRGAHVRILCRAGEYRKDLSWAEKQRLMELISVEDVFGAASEILGLAAG